MLGDDLFWLTLETFEHLKSVYLLPLEDLGHFPLLFCEMGCYYCHYCSVSVWRRVHTRCSVEKAGGSFGSLLPPLPRLYGLSSVVRLAVTNTVPTEPPHQLQKGTQYFSPFLYFPELPRCIFANSLPYVLKELCLCLSF